MTSMELEEIEKRYVDRTIPQLRAQLRGRGLPVPRAKKAMIAALVRDDQASFPTLPNEILFDILINVPLLPLLSGACKVWRDICRSSAFWRYRWRSEFPGRELPSGVSEQEWYREQAQVLRRGDWPVVFLERVDDHSIIDAFERKGYKDPRKYQLMARLAAYYGRLAVLKWVLDVEPGFWINFDDRLLLWSAALEGGHLPAVRYIIHRYPDVIKERARAANNRLLRVLVYLGNLELAHEMIRMGWATRGDLAPHESLFLDSHHQRRVQTGLSFR